MSYMLTISADQYNQQLKFSDALVFGGQMLLIGILTIFAVLTLIWAVLTIFKAVFSKLNESKNPAPVQQKAAPAPTIVSASNDEEIVAVIAAAIAAAESESGQNVKFKVVSFRRK